MNNLAFDSKNDIIEEMYSNMESKDDSETKLSDKDPMSQLEDALSLCKFGKFHIRLLLATLCATFASTMVSTTSAYILPSAECDLGMSSVQKGILNAAPFFGQVGAAMFTGFCTDAFGRKKFLVGGNVGILVCALLEGLSQSYWMLLVGKLAEGIFLSFSLSGTSSMVSEMTPRNIRQRMLLLVSTFMSVSLIVTALMSWAILPLPLHFVFSSYFELHAWNIYLVVCSVWSVIAGLLYYSLPESPKWLLSHGQEDAALNVLRDMYVENTGNTPESFPVESLKMAGAAPTISSKDISFKRQVLNGLKASKELFQRPLVWSLLVFSSMTFVCLFAYSALRLWYPQLSTMIETYIKNHESTAPFCTMINNYKEVVVKPVTSNSSSFNITTLLVKNVTDPEICVPHLSGSETYINNIGMGLISLFCLGLSTYLVDITGYKLLMFVSFFLCAVCSGSLYWTNSSFQIALLVSLACSFVQTALSLQQVVLVAVFPTNMRSLAFSVVLMCGRIGSLVGNIMFPILLEAGCMSPFLLLSTITIGIASIVYFLPSVKKEGESAK